MWKRSPFRLLLSLVCVAPPRLRGAPVLRGTRGLVLIDSEAESVREESTLSLKTRLKGRSSETSITSSGSLTGTTPTALIQKARGNSGAEDEASSDSSGEEVDSQEGATPGSFSGRINTERRHSGSRDNQGNTLGKEVFCNKANQAAMCVNGVCAQRILPEGDSGETGGKYENDAKYYGSCLSCADIQASSGCKTQRGIAGFGPDFDANCQAVCGADKETDIKATDTTTIVVCVLILLFVIGGGVALAYHAGSLDLRDREDEAEVEG